MIRSLHVVFPGCLWQVPAPDEDDYSKQGRYPNPNKYVKAAATMALNNNYTGYHLYFRHHYRAGIGR